MKQQNKTAVRPFNAAKFVFLYLTHLVSLVFTAISFGMIVFQAINKNIADPINLYSASYADELMKFGIAALLVFSPVYYIVSYFINKAVYKGDIKRDSGIRRWLTYLILFVSFLVFAGYLVGFIISFLDGELTLKFILKVISVLIIAATVFSFYFYDIMRRETEGKKSKVIKIYFISTLSAVAIIFIGSFFVVDNPMKARNARLDDEVLNKFSTIDNCVDLYYSENKKMPESMDDIKNNCDYFLDETGFDESNGKIFEYHKKADKTYELCAEFRSSNKDNEDVGNWRYNHYSLDSKSFSHDVGWQCLERKVYFADIETITK